MRRGLIWTLALMAAIPAYLSFGPTPLAAA
jgi:hypothetical protein